MGCFSYVCVNHGEDQNITPGEVVIVGMGEQRLEGTYDDYGEVYVPALNITIDLHRIDGYISEQKSFGENIGFLDAVERVRNVEKHGTEDDRLRHLSYGPALSRDPKVNPNNAFLHIKIVLKGLDFNKVENRVDPEQGFHKWFGTPERRFIQEDGKWVEDNEDDEDNEDY